MRSRLLLALIAAVALFAAACSDDSNDSSSDTTTTTAAASSDDDSSSDDSTDDSSSATEIPESTLVANLDQEYPPGGLFPAGSVTANWYQQGGNYVVVYGGLDLAAIGPACPGNSIQLSDGSFASVSNSPTGEGGCEGATTPRPGTEPMICGDLIIYRTDINTGQVGTLYGSFERSAGDGTFLGATSTVATDGKVAPEIDLGATAYEFENVEYTC